MQEKYNDEGREIRSDAKTINDLLREKYTLDYYQREYRWKKNQVTDLIDDLTSKFFNNYQKGDQRNQVESYDHYFLGSMIVSKTKGRWFIVDGQQRLTTLTLLLIKLRQLLEDESQKSQVTSLIFSEKFGQKSFNLDIEERESVMDALYSEDSLEPFKSSDQPESIRNIAECYDVIDNHFELQSDELPYFVDWLLERVYLVQITAYDERDAYTIFETMNDRGLSLTPAEMLKGYLLTNITNTDQRNNANEVWRERIQLLKDIDKDEDANAIKAWLRSQYAENIRERTRGAEPRDFELISTEFHRWVRTHNERLGLNSSNDFVRFIEKDFVFYARYYRKLIDAASSITPGFECVYYNAQNDFTLQYPVLLAPLRLEDTEEEIFRKIQIVSRYLDILIHRRIWNFRAITHSTMFYAMFLVIRDIRGKNISELVDILYTRLTEDNETFLSDNWFHLHGTNRKKVHRILARITDYVETQSGKAPRYLEYFQQGTSRYEVEHIWADHFDQHIDEFSNEIEFKEYRDYIGGLLLLPKKVNGSLNDMPYDEKRDHYLKENLLAQTLHEKTYQRNPGFLQFVEKSKLPFQAHPKFKKTDLDARQRLYQLLAEQIWNPERLKIPYGAELQIVVEPGNSDGNLRESDEDDVQSGEESPTEENNVEVLGSENENVSIDTKEISTIQNEIREYYKTKSDTTIKELCALIAELLNLIEERKWNGLTFEVRKLYCGFYLEGHPVFGVFLSKNLQFVVWMDEEDAEKLEGHYEFKYERSRRHVYFQHIRIERLRPILEFAYKKRQEY